MNHTAPALPARLPDMAAQLPDFRDRLSLMMVKELRRGMRSPGFGVGPDVEESIPGRGRGSDHAGALS